MKYDSNLNRLNQKKDSMERIVNYTLKIFHITYLQYVLYITEHTSVSALYKAVFAQCVCYIIHLFRSEVPLLLGKHLIPHHKLLNCS